MFVNKVSVKIFSSLYRFVPVTFKDIFTKDFRTRIKLLLNFSDYQNDEDRQIQLKLEEALYRIRQGELDTSLNLLKALELASQKTVARSYDGEIRYNKKLCETLLNFDEYRQQLQASTRNQSESHAKPRVAVFTANTGGYDSVKLPLFVDSEIDYFLFTDRPVPNVGFWKVKPITYYETDPTRSARFVKTHPHNLLKDYDIAVWVDGNINLVGDIQPMLKNFWESDHDVAAIPHPHRLNIYEEYEACLSLKKDDQDVMKTQIDRYRENQFDHSDLAETGFMFFKIRSKDLPGKLNAWWKEIASGSKRDQLSLNFAIGKQGYYPLTQRPQSARTHPSLAILPHNRSTDCPLMKKMGFELKDPFPTESYSQYKPVLLANQKERSIDVVVCVHNALEDVKKCLGSIDQFHKPSKQRLIVIDDGSGTETQNFLETFCSERDWCQYARSEVGRGYTKAANHGLSLSQAEMVILLNSDTIVTADWCEKIAEVMFSREDIGVVGPLSNAASHQSIPDHKSKNKQTAINNLPAGMTPDSLNQFCEENASMGFFPEVPLVHGFCFAIKRSVIQKIGFFDEKHFPRGYGEENDYCFRATNAGFSLALATHTFVFHSKSKSYQSEKRIQLMKEGIQNLIDIHGRDRINRSVLAVEMNPILMTLRSKAKKLY